MHFLKRSDTATHSFTCKQVIPAFTPQPQSITALWLVLITVPRTVEGWVDLGGWLHTEMKWRLLEANTDMCDGERLLQIEGKNVIFLTHAGHSPFFAASCIWKLISLI